METPGGDAKCPCGGWFVCANFSASSLSANRVSTRLPTQAVATLSVTSRLRAGMPTGWLRFAPGAHPKAKRRSHPLELRRTTRVGLPLCRICSKSSRGTVRRC